MSDRSSWRTNECQDRASKLQRLSADYSLKSNIAWLLAFGVGTVGFRSLVVWLVTLVVRWVSSRNCAGLKKFASARLEEDPRPISLKPGEIMRV
jgi:hypothetical protein